MPTPFYHLSVANELLQQDALPQPLRRSLFQYFPAFLLGNTAPDVQTVSGQDRLSTHFFDLPILPGASPAWENFLSACPHLTQTNHLPPAQAAFLAGYLCHLQADWLWVQDIFAPVFGPWNTWHTFGRRLYLHNVLRSYLDEKILPELQQRLSGVLSQAVPNAWLPFVGDSALVIWRDQLAQQLLPGAVSRTVEVFAERQGIPADAYYHLLGSEDRMEQEIFTRLPRQSVAAYRQRLIDANLGLLQSYLAGWPVR